MIAIADEEALVLLEFKTRKNLEANIEKLKNRTHLPIAFDAVDNPIIQSIKNELDAYFAGTLTKFKTPIRFAGTAFQKDVWQKLQTIDFGKTKSYAQIATALGKASAVRAVGAAIGANQLAIVIPCHRVINKNGTLAGYAGGLDKKQWLLQMERSAY